MATKEDHDCQREHSPNTPEFFQMFFGSPVTSEQNSPEDQTPDRQQLDPPGDAYGFRQSSVNQGGIQQLTQLHSGQRLGQPGGSNSIDQGPEQPQALMLQQPDRSRRKRQRQESNAGDKLQRKRQADRRYRNRIKSERLQTNANLENLQTEYEQLYHKYQKMKSNMEKFGAEYQKMKSDREKFEAENGQLKDECRDLKSEVQKLKAENGQLKDECQEMKSSSRKNSDTFRSFTQVSPLLPQVSGSPGGGCSVQPSNINSFDDWSHNRNNGVDEYFTEEEIRIRSHEMLENEDMQHMLPLFGMEGHASMNMPEDLYTFSPYIPSPMPRSHEMLENEDMQVMPQLFSMEGHASINMPEDRCTSPPYIRSPVPNFDEDRSHPGKIIIGWLKIKAFIWCGLYIRKKAAERRVQTLELEEEEWQSAFSLWGSPFFA